jgi:hypothetical protein
MSFKTCYLQGFSVWLYLFSNMLITSHLLYIFTQSVGLYVHVYNCYTELYNNTKAVELECKYLDLYHFKHTYSENFNFTALTGFPCACF